MRTRLTTVVEETHLHPSSQLKHSFCKFRVRAIVLALVALVSVSVAQQPFLTSHNDNTRSGANTNETLLTPANVNKTTFGLLWSSPIDYQALAQPLYMPNVTINTGPYQGTVHNVLYVVTQSDNVYAFDAENGAQLWEVSMLMGGQTASVAAGTLPCGLESGYNQEGIPGTPVIDPNTNTMYLVAKTVINGTVYHYLHALDITTGLDQTSMNSPVQIVATSTSKKGHVMNFWSLHQKNRPGALELNGVLYLGFGSNSCNDDNTGWLLAYNVSNLQQQLGAFNTSPDTGLTSIWQTGAGIAADDEGNVFFETAESANYDVPSGGQSYSNSVLKVSPQDQLLDYFTPANVAYLNKNDLDLSSSGVVILPDQPGTYPHEAIASGKQGNIYLLNRDGMGMYQVGDAGAIQEVSSLETCASPCLPLNVDVGGMFSSAAYWNNTIYTAGDAEPIMGFPLIPGSNGAQILGTPVQSSGKHTGGHSPSISANGNTNGVLWVLTGPLQAYNATTLQMIYASNQAGSRDTLQPIAHFATQTAVNGMVFVATQTTLQAYGLFDALTINAGNNQTAPVLTQLPQSIQLTAASPYTGVPDVGVTVTFSDGGKGGTFNPPTAVTNSNGSVSTAYTFPKKSGTYTLTATAPNISTATLTEIATPTAPKTLISYGGNKQTGAAGSVLTKAVVAEVEDQYSNPVPGVTVTFSANNGATPNPVSPVTGANGLASTYLQLPTTVSTITVTANSTNLKKTTYTEYSVAGPAAQANVNGGNNQTATAGTTLPQALSVFVGDQYGNPVSGVSVSFSDGGAGGSFSSNPVTTGTNGIASVNYTLPSTPGSVTITGTASGVSNPAVFNETGQ